MGEVTNDALLKLAGLPQHPQADLLIEIITGPTNLSSSGFPYISDQSFNLFISKIPHLFRHGGTTLHWLGTLNKQLEAIGGISPARVESIPRAISVLHTVIFTAAVTAPPDLWLLRQLLATYKALGIVDDLSSKDGIEPEEYASRRKFSRKQLMSDLNLIYSRGYLKKVENRFFAADDPLVARGLRAIPPIDARYRINMVPPFVDWFTKHSAGHEEFLRNWLSIGAVEQPTGCWIADAFQIELGYCLLPFVLSLRVCGLTGRLRLGVAVAETVPEIMPEMIDICEQAGVTDNGRVTELGARVFERGPGPFGIIAAYHSYLNNLESLLKLNSPEVHVQRSANVAASQDANRKTFEEANDQLDAFCKEYGFRYSVFIEHAVGRGEATRQRLNRSGETQIRYFGADLEDAAIDQAIQQQKQGALPKNMEFIRSADIGEPERVIRFLHKEGLAGEQAVMMVGNGFHEIRQQTNSKMIDVFRAYCEAGFVLIFTEESALENDDLLHTAWNTYHSGFRYVHELSGQGLRPAIDRAGQSGRWSWHRCATEAGYVVLDKFSYKSRTIYPYRKPERENPSISETYFCVPLKIAVALRVPSPNSDERPIGLKIDTVVLHATVLHTIAEVVRRFADPRSRVSAHYTIDRDGSIVSHVPDERRAWHAGKSKMKDGRESVNDFSIGIELVNLNDGRDPFPTTQIEALNSLLRQIARRHPIQHIVMHSECAEPPGRKSDPAGFDRAWIRDVLDEIAPGAS